MNAQICESPSLKKYNTFWQLFPSSRMERGIINAGLSQLFKIAEALEIHPKELFDFEWEEEE